MPKALDHLVKVCLWMAIQSVQTAEVQEPEHVNLTGETKNELKNPKIGPLYQ